MKLNRPGLGGLLVLLAATSACTLNVPPELLKPPVPGASAAPAAAPTASAAPSPAASTAPAASAKPAAGASKPPVKVSPAPAPGKDEPVEIEEWFEDPELGVDVDDYDAEGGYDEDGDGAVDTKGDMTVEYGGEAHEVTFEEDDAPVMADGYDVFFARDQKTGVQRMYSTDQDFTYYLIQENEDKSFEELTMDELLQVDLNPDGSFAVNGDRAEDLQAAAKMIAKHPMASGDTLHVLGALLGRLNHVIAEEESRSTSPTTCIPGMNCYVVLDGEARVINMNTAAALTRAVIEELQATDGTATGEDGEEAEGEDDAAEDEVDGDEAVEEDEEEA